MYYHIRLDKVLHDGSVNKDESRKWNVRSLHQGLSMLKRDFGAEAKDWSIEDLTECTPDLILLENVLKDALPSAYQYLIMSFRSDSALAQVYDHYRFFVFARDEEFTFSESEEATIVAPETSR